MTFWERLRQRKLVQWALAYLAGAWLLLQVLHLLGETYAWPPGLMRSIPVVLAGGFLVALVLSWYHGEKGRQRVTAPEVALIGVIAAAVTAAVLRTGGAAERDDAGWAGLAAAADAGSVAVLPFANDSPDPAQDYFADGITEEILNALARISEIRVPARTSSFHYKGRNLPIREIASQLGVGTVLEGRVRRDGGRVRINAQLIDARDDRIIWLDQFDHELDDVFAVQTEIARAVTQALRVRLTGDTSALPVVPRRIGAAHDLYLQGLFHWNRRSAAHLQQAVTYFEEAARVDPSYAEAYAGLAVAHAVTPLYARDQTVSAAVARVEAAAARALALDPTLALAHAALGYIYHWQWRWEDAEREFALAIAADPRLTSARQWYGEHLAKLGRGEEGIAQLREAVDIDPMSAVAHGNLGLVLLIAGHDDEAVAQLERTHAMDPSLPFPLVVLHKYYVSEGRLADASRTGRLWAELSGVADPADIVTLTEATQRPELRAAAARVLADWQRLPAPPWADMALYMLLMDMRDDALTALEHGFRNRDPMMTTLASSRWFDPLRTDPRFQRIMRDMRLTDATGSRIS